MKVETLLFDLNRQLIRRTEERVVTDNLLNGSCLTGIDQENKELRKGCTQITYES